MYHVVSPINHSYDSEENQLSYIYLEPPTKKLHSRAANVEWKWNFFKGWRYLSQQLVLSRSTLPVMTCEPGTVGQLLGIVHVWTLGLCLPTLMFFFILCWFHDGTDQHPSSSTCRRTAHNEADKVVKLSSLHFTEPTSPTKIQWLWKTQIVGSISN